MKLRLLFAAWVMIGFVPVAFAENDGEKEKKNEGYVFEDKIVLPATPVKDQYRSGNLLVVFRVVVSRIGNVAFGKTRSRSIGNVYCLVHLLRESKKACSFAR
jgi:hypothetical protein